LDFSFWITLHSILVSSVVGKTLTQRSLRRTVRSLLKLEKHRGHGRVLVPARVQAATVIQNPKSLARLCLRPRFNGILNESPKPRQLNAYIFAQMQPENSPLLAD